jgi:hypothetical protein
VEEKRAEELTCVAGLLIFLVVLADSNDAKLPHGDGKEPLFSLPSGSQRG